MSRRIGAVFVVALALFAGACGSSSKDSSSGNAATTTTVSESNPALTGDLDVFAAASLTAAFTEAGESLEAANEGLKITNNFAGSQALVKQIQDGAPADVFASADEKNMKTLQDADLVETPQVFAKNRLQIAVAPGNPKNIKTLADTEKDGVILVLADETVPAGKYARQAYENAGLPAPKPKSNELDVKSTMAKLTSGEADVVVVYVTDVTAAGDKVEGVEIPDNQNVIAVYPIAVVKASKNKGAAEAYVDAIVSGDGQTTLKENGFLPPS